VKFTHLPHFRAVWLTLKIVQNVWKWYGWCLGAGKSSSLDQDSAWNQGFGVAYELSNMLPAYGTSHIQVLTMENNTNCQIYYGEARWKVLYKRDWESILEMGAWEVRVTELVAHWL
jgi:hypothetical protein